MKAGHELSVDNDLISEAIDFKPEPNRVIFPKRCWLRACVCVLLTKGKRVPITKFETKSGGLGFLISSCKKDDDVIPSATIISSDDDAVGYYPEVGDLIREPSTHYFFFVCGENSVEPYTFPLMLTDSDTSEKSLYKATIVSEEADYYIELSDGVVIKERKEQPRK